MPFHYVLILFVLIKRPTCNYTFLNIFFMSEVLIYITQKHLRKHGFCPIKIKRSKVSGIHINFLTIGRYCGAIQTCLGSFLVYLDLWRPLCRLKLASFGGYCLCILLPRLNRFYIHKYISTILSLAVGYLLRNTLYLRYFCNNIYYLVDMKLKINFDICIYIKDPVIFLQEIIFAYKRVS